MGARGARKLSQKLLSLARCTILHIKSFQRPQTKYSVLLALGLNITLLAMSNVGDEHPYMHDVLPVREPELARAS